MEQLIGADWGDFARPANGAFLLAFPSLFSIINPIGGAFIFYGVTRDFSGADKEKAAALVGFYSLAIMFGALWAGAYVLRFFGVSIDALRIAGGTVVALSGWRLLTSAETHPDRKGHESAEQAGVYGDPMQLAFFPLTLPFTTGPGTIAVAVTLGAERTPGEAGFFAFFLGVSLAAVFNAALIWILYRSADRLTHFMGPTAQAVIVRLTAFLLMCIGVQILVTAVGDLALKWRAA
jgi:multiple antibiotic resistance protein